MKRKSLLVGVFVSLLFVSCSKPMMQGKVSPSLHYFSRTFDTTANDAYYAVREALQNAGYTVGAEDLQKGIVQTTWVPSTADSHCVEVFERCETSLNGAYRQLDVRIVPAGGDVEVRVASRVKSIVVRLQSTGFEEHKILDGVAGYLRTHEPTVTNLGIQD